MAYPQLTEIKEPPRHQLKEHDDYGYGERARGNRFYWEKLHYWSIGGSKVAAVIADVIGFCRNYPTNRLVPFARGSWSTIYSSEM